MGSFCLHSRKGDSIIFFGFLCSGQQKFLLSLFSCDLSSFSLILALLFGDWLYGRGGGWKRLGCFVNILSLDSSSALWKPTAALLILENIFLACLFLYLWSTRKPMLEGRWSLSRDWTTWKIIGAFKHFRCLEIALSETVFCFRNR